jgi:thiamine biosynthesis protein ThiI
MKALILLSTGIDSPVAAHLAKKKSLDLIGLNFYSKTLTDNHKKSVCQLAKLSGIKKVYFIDHSISNKEYANKCNSRYQCVFCKRNMLRVAEKLALKEECNFILTGDNIGQVASQTLNNMKVISGVTNFIILRPLLTYNKNEIINIAKQIGSFKINNINNFICPYLPDKPVTKLDKNKILIEEKKLNVEETNSEIIKDTITIELH